MANRRLALELIIWPLMLATTLPVLATQDADAARSVARYLEGLSSLEAEFRQVSTLSGDSAAQVSYGRLYLQKPGRFRWDYQRPSEQLIVSDGVNLWLYDRELEQVTVKSIDESLATTPALLLAGRSGVADSFTISAAGFRDGIEWVQLTPKRADTDFTQFRLGFVRGELRMMELEDKLQQTTRIEFSDVRRNARLAGHLFEFTPPPGVDVIGTSRP